VPDLISRNTRNQFREHLVSYTLGEIDMAFGVGDLSPDLKFVPPNTGGQRRIRVEQYYSWINWSDANVVRRVLDVFETILNNLDDAIAQHPNSDAGKAERTKLLRAIARDGYKYENGRLAATSPHIADVSVALAQVDAPELQRQIVRIQNAIESDPALAVGTAKELVESACKTILEERGFSIDPEWDLVRLGKETRECLQLLPANVHESAKGAESIKKLLANLGVVVQSLAEVRNLYGTGHGRTQKKQAMQPRHARLAAGAATTLATFLLETHWERGLDPRDAA
jgi:hypothetical protein